MWCGSPICPAGTCASRIGSRRGSISSITIGVRILLAQVPAGQMGRSEEHTSELQSLRHLVCRLLLEKKKPDEVEDLRRGRRHADLHVVLGAPLQIKLEPRDAVLEPLSFIAVRPVLGHAADATPLVPT